MNLSSVKFLVLSVMVLSMSSCRETGSWQGGAVFDRVLIVVLENTDYADAMQDPYFQELAHKGTLFENFDGNFHPSYPNYLAMVGGKFFWTFFDSQKDIDAPSIADLLEAKGLTWKNYAEGYPGNCFLGSTQGRYARKHVPFLSFVPIQSHPERCARVVPGEEFAKNHRSGDLPTYMFYSPDLDNDGHDTGLPFASKWLKAFLDPLLADPEFMKHTLIEVTFDESGSYLTSKIATLFLGDMVKAGHIESRDMNHYHVLRTIEDNFGLGTLHAEDANVSPILDVWKNPMAGALLESSAR